MADEYATVAEIQKEFKQLNLTGPSGIQTTTLDEWRDQESEYINGRVVTKYKVPVLEADSPKAFLVLKEICIWLVSKRIQETLEVKTTVPEGEQLVTGGDLRTMAKARLKEIAEGTLILRDAEFLNSAQGISSFSVDPGLEHVFQKGDPSRDINDQW